MKILYLNPTGLLGGAEAALLDMLASLRTAAPDCDLDLIIGGDGPLAARARHLGVRTFVVPFPRSLARLGDASISETTGKLSKRLRLLGRLLLAGPLIVIYTFRLRARVRELQADVIHAHGFKMHVLGALVKPAGVSLIWHIHDYVSRRPFMARLIKLLQRRCSQVLSNSNSVKSDIENLCKKVRVTTVYNGIDTSVFSPAGPAIDLDGLCGLGPAANFANPLIRIGLVATLARWKGQEVFLRAFSLIPECLPLRGYIIGGALYQTEGSQYSIPELKALARQLGVADRVGFTGFIEQPAAAMRSLDIVVHASTQPEPFGLVIVEGMACGRPVIVSNAGGASELIESGTSSFAGKTNALAHSPGDAWQLAERIKQLATNSELRMSLGKAGRANSETRFDRARLGAELLPIYQAVMKSQRLSTSLAP